MTHDQVVHHVLDALTQDANGRDLTLPEDRVLFRLGVERSLRYCRVAAIRSLAREAGAPGAVPTNRAGASKALANALITTILRGG